MIFGHRKCFGVYRVIIGVPEGVPDTPGRLVGLLGHKRGAHQPKRGWRASHGSRPSGERKGGIRLPPSFLSPLSFPPPTNMAGGARPRAGAQVGFRPTWSALWPLPSPSHLYICGGHLAHARQLPSRVRRPPPSFTPPRIF